MKRVLFLSIFLLAGVYSFAQMQELEEDRPPMFDHPQGKKWGDYVIWGNTTTFALVYGEFSKRHCSIDTIIVECILTKNNKIRSISITSKLSNTILTSIQESVLASEKYWKPKKIRGRYVNAKIIFVWIPIVNKRCENENNYNYIFEAIKCIDKAGGQTAFLLNNKKYFKYDYKEEFNSYFQ
jgi:hypothetical protein